MPRVLTDEEKAFLTRPHTRHLWGEPHTVTPALVEHVFGDGERLLVLTPIMTRPNYYVVQIDSAWEVGGAEFFEHIDEIYDAIHEQYGCDTDEGFEDEDFPVLASGGSTWGEIGDLAAEMKAEASPAAA